MGFSPDVITRCKKTSKELWNIRGRILRIEGEKYKVSSYIAEQLKLIWEG